MTHQLLVWGRALLLASIAAMLGGTAHVTAGGLLPGPIALALMVAVLTVLAAPALTVQASYRRLAALVGGGQMIVHLVLTATAGHTAPHAASSPRSGVVPGPDRAGGVRDQLAVVSDADDVGPAAGQGLQHLLDHLAGTNALMAAAHLVAAAGIALWLWRGEQALWTLLALLTRWLRRPERLAESNPRLRFGAGSFAPPAPPFTRWEATASISRRGPPVLA